MGAEFSDSPADGQKLWDSSQLNFAIQELRREYPGTQAEQIMQSVGLAASSLEPTVGRVALLQRARERLRKLP